LATSFSNPYGSRRDPLSFPTRRSSDLQQSRRDTHRCAAPSLPAAGSRITPGGSPTRGSGTCWPAPNGSTCPSAEKRGKTSDWPVDRKSTRQLQSRENLVCRLLLEKKKN